MSLMEVDDRREKKRMAYLIQRLEQHSELLGEFAELLEEMQAHYDVPCPTRENILNGLKERPDASEIIIITEQGTILGFAAFSALYPGPYLQPGLFLKELYVRQRYRSRGLGQKLLAHLAQLAVERGLSRIDWTADANDDRLLRFYDNIGGTQKPEKIFYRLDGEALKRLAN